MTMDSTKPGMAPRSRRFQSAKSSLIQSFPNNSIAKCSTLCEAAPSNAGKYQEWIGFFLNFEVNFVRNLYKDSQ